MAKEKYYSSWAKVKTNDGKDHYVTVVGKFVQKRGKELVHEETQVETKPNCFSDAILTYEVKKLKRTLTLGLSICHPCDTFDENVGIEIAKKRIERGENIGTLETNDVAMLTEDAIMGEIIVKLSYVTDHINDYISEN